MSKPIDQFLIEWGQTPPGQDKPGHVVVVLGAGAPTIVHDTIEDAEKEAKRLIGTLTTTVNQTALVLTITSAVTRMKQHTPPIEVVRLAATSPPSMKVGDQPPDLKFPIHPASFPAPKFKPGDRVYYDSKLDGRRVYGTVVPAEQWPLFGKGALPDQDPVFALWGTSPEVGFMPADRVFADLRTIAGGGTLTLEAGRKGKTRGGREAGPFESNGRIVHGWKAAPFGAYAKDGFFYGPSHTDDRDIVELLPEGA